MNYTEKYHLPQWEETDRIMMDDFNQMCGNIEEGIRETRVVADQGLAQANTLPYVAGTYQGTSKAQSINIGFRPSFLITSGAEWGANSGYFVDAHYRIAFTAGTTATSSVVFTDTGFDLKPGDMNGPYPVINLKGRTYEYIAFK